MNTIEQHFDENMKYHRIDGPALVTDMSEYWLIHGQLHRENGPAKILKSKFKNREEYYLNGIRYAKNNFDTKILSMKLEMLLGKLNETNTN